jgi:putative PIN family toxin of toxin-antitoxin system
MEFLQAFLINAKQVPVTSIIADCRDPKDNKFLELAIDGNADYIITGDPDLLILHPYRGISIVTPAQFLSILINEK